MFFSSFRHFDMYSFQRSIIIIIIIIISFFYNFFIQVLSNNRGRVKTACLSIFHEDV